MQMNISEFAKRLEGRKYRNEITKDEELFAKQNNLVIVFGVSDDLVELRGAINDEFDCYNGSSIFIKSDGSVISEESFEELLSSKQNISSNIHRLDALWCNDNIISWKYKIDVPFEQFNIVDDDRIYCVGIVFSMDSFTVE